MRNKKEMKPKKEYIDKRQNGRETLTLPTSSSSSSLLPKQKTTEIKKN